jgi:hypothetical protein
LDAHEHGLGATRYASRRHGVSLGNVPLRRCDSQPDLRRESRLRYARGRMRELTMLDLQRCTAGRDDTQSRRQCARGTFCSAVAPLDELHSDPR